MSHDENTRSLYLIRHGLPDYRGRRSGDRWPGPPLSAIGHQHAHDVMRALITAQLKSVYASPLTRTQQTAAPLARVKQLPIQTSADLIEWQRAERLGGQALRLSRWYHRWLASGEETAAVFSHASPLLAIIRAALYLPHQTWHYPKLPAFMRRDTTDQLQIEMGSVYQLEIGATRTTLARMHSATPSVLQVHVGAVTRRLPQAVCGARRAERREVRRPSRLPSQARSSRVD